jgi:hypothetical protein
VTPSPRSRPRFSRTLALARWPEYRELLRVALDEGYEVVALEDWLEDPPEGRCIILRHDVDQHPRSALKMAGLEEDIGLRSTWYFRWRTADERAVASLRDRGFQVGLHYETLSRVVLALKLEAHEVTPFLIEWCRGALKDEIEAFETRFGPIRSICPHGDSRVPFINNGALTRHISVESLGVRWDSNDAMRGRRLGHWLTDRSVADGNWHAGVDPRELLRQGLTSILCLTHPNNWVSGPGLWADRAVRLAALPYTVRRGRPPAILSCTGIDRPPSFHA